jgi:hypothetical protein
MLILLIRLHLIRHMNDMVNPGELQAGLCAVLILLIPWMHRTAPPCHDAASPLRVRSPPSVACDADANDARRRAQGLSVELAAAAEATCGAAVAPLAMVAGVRSGRIAVSETIGAERMAVGGGFARRGSAPHHPPTLLLTRSSVRDHPWIHHSRKVLRRIVTAGTMCSASSPSL